MTIPNAILPYSVSLEFSGTQLPMLVPNWLKVCQQEFMHDTVQMQIWADDANSDSYVSGMPMTLTFGRPSVKRLFHGYVNHVTRPSNSLAGQSLTDRNSTWITCVGASFFMKQKGTQSFAAQTASQIVQTIADQFNLSTDIVPHSTVWPVIQMAGMSYWEFCVRLAKRIGYTFYCNGTQLVFKPRQTNPGNISGLVAFYDYRGNPGGFPVFTPTLGVTNPTGGEYVNRKFASIDPRTNQIIYTQVSGNPAATVLGTTTNTPLFDRTEHFTVATQDEATAKMQGAGQSNQLYITAKATAAGNPMVSQGSLIYVANANGSQNGLWYVEKADHCIDKSTYTTEMCLGRDSLGATAYINAAIKTKSAPKTYLVNQRWVAA